MSAKTFSLFHVFIEMLFCQKKLEMIAVIENDGSCLKQPFEKRCIFKKKLYEIIDSVMNNFNNEYYFLCEVNEMNKNSSTHSKHIAIALKYFMW